MKFPSCVALSVTLLAPCVALAQGNSGNTPASSRPVSTDPTKPVHPSVLTSADPTKPPPFVDLPGLTARTAPAVDAATAAIPPGLRKKLDSEHADWAKGKGAGAFSPNLSYVGGHPILLLVTSLDEPMPVKMRRLQVVIEACALHVNDDAFERTVICVAEIDPVQPTKVTTRNTEVRREKLQAALKKISGAPNVTAALAAARGDNSATIYQQVCAELGIR